MCANFASCSKDDEPKKNDSGVVSNEKKVVEITDYYVTRWGEQSHTIKFVYDEQKRLIKAKNSSDNYTEYYIWKENLIENYYGEDNLEPGTEVILVKDKNVINIITEWYYVR